MAPLVVVNTRPSRPVTYVLRCSSRAGRSRAPDRDGQRVLGHVDVRSSERGEFAEAQPAETTEQDQGLVSRSDLLGQRADLVGSECDGLGLAVLHGRALDPRRVGIENLVIDGLIEDCP
jgi:hypothetical protein